MQESRLVIIQPFEMANQQYLSWGEKVKGFCADVSGGESERKLQSIEILLLARG
jgi:hypothetical protein